MPTFVVEDGTGLSNATSYLSDAEADDILSIHPTMYPTWSGLTQNDKQTWLMWATQFLDLNISPYGQPTSETQSLRFPRRNLKTCDGIDIPDDAVPTQIKVSTALIAGYYTTNSTTNPYQPLDEQLDIKRVKIAELSVDFTDGTRTTSLNRYPPFLDASLLDCLADWDIGSQQTSTFGYIY